MKKIEYHFRVRVGKQTPQVTVVYEGYCGDNYTISNGKIIKFHSIDDGVFKVDEKHSSKRWPKYIDCTINEDGLQIEYKGQISNIEVRTHVNPCTSFINIISFETYE
jgi:hypothetical protein